MKLKELTAKLDSALGVTNTDITNEYEVIVKHELQGSQVTDVTVEAGQVVFDTSKKRTKIGEWQEEITSFAEDLKILMSKIPKGSTLDAKTLNNFLDDLSTIKEKFLEQMMLQGFKIQQQSDHKLN
jgi:hypothetical protein